MVGVTFFGNVDLALIALYLFWVFFAGLVVYLQTENMREGYPLVDDDGKQVSSGGLFPLPSPKTYLLPDGHGEVTVPSPDNESRHERTDLALARTSRAGGAPWVPTGDPMADGVGPASWAPRRDIPEADAHGNPKIRPMSQLSDFAVSSGRDPRGLPVVAGDGEVIGRVADLMIDVPESLVRYLVIDLNPEGTGQHRLLPITFCRIKSDRVAVKSLYGAQFAGIPTARSDGQVTLLEEEKIAAYYGGGLLYADPARLGPKF